jgi:hypothetical protein
VLGRPLPRLIATVAAVLVVGAPAADAQTNNISTIAGNGTGGTVRGTAWLTKNTCSGTLTRVRSGSVRVRDLTRRRTRVLRAGQSYLARSPVRKKRR